jgi:hypothetical protein
MVKFEATKIRNTAWAIPANGFPLKPFMAALLPVNFLALSRHDTEGFPLYDFLEEEAACPDHNRTPQPQSLERQAADHRIP